MDWQQDYERKQITLDQVFEEHLTGTTSTSNKLFDKNTASSSHDSSQEAEDKNSTWAGPCAYHHYQ